MPVWQGFGLTVAICAENPEPQSRRGCKFLTLTPYYSLENFLLIDSSWTEGPGSVGPRSYHLR